MNDKATNAVTAAGKLQIFRWSDGVGLLESEAMSYAGLTPEISNGLIKLNEAGLQEGTQTRILFEGAGFSLTHAWFKSGFPLPVHTHSADCLYYIVSGSLMLGTEKLSAGDGFLVPAEAAYGYTPGENGVEVLEFRNCETFDIRFLAKGSKFWEKAAEKVQQAQSRWEGERRPPLNVA